MNTEFIKSYCPKDRHFTSEEEANLIKESLNFKSLSFEELRSLRNSIVTMFANSELDYLPMASIISVLDYYIAETYGDAYLL